MSLTSGIHCPRTPLRRFLDRELSAGAHLLRKSFRARDQSTQILLPGPGVGTEAGNVGTAIDYRLRLAFTTAEPVDQVARAGIVLTAATDDSNDSDARRRMRKVGEELAARLEETVLGLQLDNRELPMDRAHDEEEALARMLIAASWYQVNYRNSYGFSYTPLAITAREDPGAFTLERLLELPHRDMVADVVAQLYKAADGPLDALRPYPARGLHTGTHVPHRPDQRGRRPRRRRTAARLQEHPVHPHAPPGRSVAAGRLPAARRRRPVPDRHRRPVPVALRHARQLAGRGVPGPPWGLPSRPRRLPWRVHRAARRLHGRCRSVRAGGRGPGPAAAAAAGPRRRPGPLPGVHTTLPRLGPPDPRVLLALVPQPRPDSAQQGSATRRSGPAVPPPPQGAPGAPCRRAGCESHRPFAEVDAARREAVRCEGSRRPGPAAAL